jgi:AAA15 family ATPase/GTPase
MKEQMILKTELISRLSHIYGQLEELEAVLHSSYLRLTDETMNEQLEKVDQCSKKLTELEDEFFKTVGMKKEKKVNREAQTPLHSSNINFKLGFKGL